MSKQVLPRRGLKLNTDDVDFEKQREESGPQLEQKRQIYKKSLTQKPKRRLKDVSVGEYIKSLNLVFVIQPRGKISSTLGKSVSRSLWPSTEPLYCDVLCVEGATVPTYLDYHITCQSHSTVRMYYPEEALYMVDIGALALYATNDTTELINVIVKKDNSPDRIEQCRRGNLLSTTQEAFGLFSHYYEGETFVNTFRLYAHMRKAGYFIRRHDPVVYGFKLDTFANFMRDTFDKKAGGGKNVGKRKKPQKQNTQKPKKIPKASNGSGPVRGWYTEQDDIEQEKEEKMISEHAWGHEDIFTQDTKPLIFDLNLKHGDKIGKEKLFEQLDVIPMVEARAISTADKYVIFDVWKDRLKNQPPAMAISLQAQDGTTDLSWADEGVMSYWKTLKTDIPIHRAVIGQSGTVTFMSLKPFALENLMK